MQVIVDSLPTNYTLAGSGQKTILFLHGWADNGKTFDPLVKELSAKLIGYSYVQLDLPGFGGTSRPTEPWNLESYAKFVASFLEKTGISPDVIVGHSNGGAIAIKGMAGSLFSAKKLVLIASAGIRDNSLKKVFYRSAAKPAKIVIKLAPGSAGQTLRRKLYTAIGSDYLVAENMQETFKKVVKEDLRLEASKITIPTSLIYGETDSATPPSYGQIFYQSIRGSKFHPVPLAGHFVHQEQAYKVATLIKSFVDPQ